MTDHTCIIGAGITGLASAIILSDTHRVSIIARDMPGDIGLDWASPWAGAVFHPQKTNSEIEQRMQRDSFNFYWNLAKSNPESGVQVLPMTEYFDDRTDDREIWYKDFMPGYTIVSKEDLPEGCTFGLRYTALAMNPSILLLWLREKLLEKGVTFTRMTVHSFDQARSLLGNVKFIVNASGVGAQELAGDNNVKPIRGQTMFVRTDFKQLVMKEGSEYTYVIPRAGSGGVILGGIKSDRSDSEVDVKLKSDILKRVNRITSGAFEKVDLQSVTDIIGFRPGREGGIRVERENDVVHAYGNAGAGYIYSFGVARRVKELLKGSERSSRL